MKLVLHLTPNPITFHLVGTDNEYPLLISPNTLRLSARAGTPAGLTANESGSVEVKLDNSKERFTRRVPYHMRLRAELFDKDGNLAFEGVVSTTQMGNTVVLGLES